MMRTPIHGRAALTIHGLLVMIPLASGCAAGGASEDALEPPAPATPIEATAAAPSATPERQAEAVDSATEPAAAGGIFTEPQADRGETTFDEVCSDCHTDSEFRGRAFQSNWGHRTVYSFYRTVRSTMPDDNPGGLDPQVYLDVVAYILSLNGHEAGESELSDDSPMREVRIDPDSEG